MKLPGERSGRRRSREAGRAVEDQGKEGEEPALRTEDGDDATERRSKEEEEEEKEEEEEEEEGGEGRGVDADRQICEAMPEHMKGLERNMAPRVASNGEEAEQRKEEDGEGGVEADTERQISEAMLEYMDGLEEKIAGAEDDSGAEKLQESDSSEEEFPSRNTIGNVPLEWYKDETHIGYDIAGRKICKMEKKDQLDSFLARLDSSKEWWKVYDEYNDEEVELTKEEIELISRIRKGRIPHTEVNPYEAYVDWFDWEDKGHPLSNAPEPKRRFVPSKWEAKKVVKLVRAIRKGWIKLEKPKEKPKYYLMWGDDLKTMDKTANGLVYIPAPKANVPGHEESYNPPPEYIPSQEEINSYALLYEEDRPKFIPKRFDSLRQVPAYMDFIKERFERCLDLYLCPRSRKKRINIDPESLIPRLPKPKDLQPFPTTCYIEFRGHTGPVLSISPHPSGEWVASGSGDGTVRLWEVQTGRCIQLWNMEMPINHVAWNPISDSRILAIAMGKKIALLDVELPGEADTPIRELLTVKSQVQNAAILESESLVTWSQLENFRGLQLDHKQVVSSVCWHHKGDYFSTVTPDGNTRSVLIHQLSKQQTQNPFPKMRGSVVRVLFHPSRPFFFVASKTHIRVYNLAKQQLSKKLMSGLQEISSFAIHPAGDNLVVGSREGKICWLDMDLATKPYKTLKNHQQDIHAVAFHPSYPLFASCSDDSTAHVFHGMVYSDMLQNPLIVPLKILGGHKSVNRRGVLDCQFHPQQPWLFTAGADSVMKLFCN